MKTFKLRVATSFFDKQENAKRPKGSTFQITDEERVKQLVKLKYVDLLSVTNIEQTNPVTTTATLEEFRPKKKRRKKGSVTGSSKSQSSPRPTGSQGGSKVSE